MIPTTNVKAIDRFRQIPNPPDDLVAYRRDIERGQLVDLCDIPEEYWKRPEFYDAWDRVKPIFYDNPDYSTWGVYGYGVSPSEVGYSVENMKAGDSFEVCAFFMNGWGVWTYQGFRLIGTKDEYFLVEVTPNEFMLHPTFPVIEYEWIKKVTVKVTALQDIPIGEYHLGFDAVSPSPDFSRNMTKTVLKSHFENKEEYIEECVEFLNNRDQCNYLIDMRQKKYVDGGTYRPANRLFNIIVGANVI